MVAKKGAKHHAAKLDEGIVRDARRIYRRNKWVEVDGVRVPVSISSLARKYGVAHQTMHAAITGQTWTHV